MQQSTAFDFDRLCALAATSPADFAAERARLIEQLMEQAPTGAWPEGFLFALDADRYSRAPGLAASLGALVMTMDSMNALTESIEQLAEEILNVLPAQQATTSTPAAKKDLR